MTHEQNRKPRSTNTGRRSAKLDPIANSNEKWVGKMKPKAKTKAQKKQPERKAQSQSKAKHPKRGQPAMMESILELTQKALPKDDDFKEKP